MKILTNKLLNLKMNFNKIPSKERAFSEVYGGYYDEHGFYNSPNGSKV